MDEFVSGLSAKGLLTPAAAQRVDEIESRAHLPLARELHALLYVGAALILAGVGATVKDRLDELGPMTIATCLGLAAAACLGYAFRTGRPFAPGKVESPTAAFDYVLYLGCGLVGIFFSYLEFKWKLLGSWWDLYLLGSGMLFAAMAYRFDNRLVLATGLMNLAAWLGLRTGRWDMGLGATKPALVAYGAALIGIAYATRRGELKPHFEGTYRTLGVHLALATLLSDGTKFSRPEYWILAVACAALAWWSMTERRFDTFATAAGYAYVATLVACLELVGSGSADLTLWIVVLSAGASLAILLWARARFRESVS